MMRTIEILIIELLHPLGLGIALRFLPFDHSKVKYAKTSLHWLFHLAILFTQRQYAMISEKSSNKKVSLLTNRNLISDCQVSLLTHLETDHSLMSSCGGRR